MLVETPEKLGFLLLPGFDNAFPGCRFVALVGGLVGGLFMPDSGGQTNHFWEKIDEAKIRSLIPWMKRTLLTSTRDRFFGVSQ